MVIGTTPCTAPFRHFDSDMYTFSLNFIDRVIIQTVKMAEIAYCLHLLPVAKSRDFQKYPDGRRALFTLNHFLKLTRIKLFSFLKVSIRHIHVTALYIEVNIIVHFHSLNAEMIPYFETAEMY